MGKRDMKTTPKKLRKTIMLGGMSVDEAASTDCDILNKFIRDFYA